MERRMSPRHAAARLGLPVFGLLACTFTTPGTNSGAAHPLRVSAPVPVTAGAPQPAAAPSRAAELVPLNFRTGSTIPVEADDAVWGGAEAPVTIVAFLDYQCPYCAQGWGLLGELSAQYGGDIRIVFKQLPLAMHEQAYPSAVAAQAVLALGGTNAFRHYSELMFTHAGVLSDAQREKWAVAVGVGADRYRAAIADPRYGQQVLRDAQFAQTNGIDATPAFVINGLLLMGVAPVEEFGAVIDRELPEARAAERQGLAPPAVYEARVRANTEVAN
jgi:protein-disulfide isomerase